jgi:PAS domain S-box-containing protein
MDVYPVSASDIEQILAVLPAAVYVCEAPGGEIRLWNRRAVELWGREPANGETVERFCGAVRLFRTDGSPLPHASSPMADVLRTGEPHAGEIVIARPDGSRVTVRVHIVPLRHSSGRLTGAVNLCQDITDQRSADEALRLSEARYRAIVEDQPDLVCRFHPDGTLSFANEAYCAYFGLRRPDALGTRYTPLVHADDFAKVQALVSSLSPANPVVFIENRVIRADGVVRWTQWTNRALYDHHNVLIELQAAGRDITERKQAEEDAARLAAIVTSADAAIYAMTLDGVITSWNSAAERMFGYSGSDAINQCVGIVVPSDRSAEAAEIRERVRDGDTITDLETEGVSSDGRRIPIALTASPIRDTNGRTIGISIIARNITAQKQGEKDLQGYVRTLEQLYRLADTIGRAQGLNDVCEAAVEAIVEMAGIPRASVLIFDADGVMRFKAWRGLSAAYRAAVDGHSPWTPDVREPSALLVEDVLTDSSAAPLREVITSEGMRALAFIPLVYHGRLLGKFMLYYDAPHRFTADELRLAATIAHHVAFGVARAQADAAIVDALNRERVARADADAARAEAERASEAKDEFLAMLAHELRNPLGVIATAAAVLDGTDQTDPRHSRSRAAIRRQTDHLARLLDDLLDVARITRGQIQLQQTPLDLRGVIELSVESQRHRIDAKRQDLLASVPDAPVVVMGDSVRLQQVFGNLLNNASKYSGVGGRVSILLEAENQAVVRVRDNGAGLPPGRLEWIFELFAQANPTLARTEGGLGIGLTVVRRLVELHGGRIRALSEGVGRGAEFIVELPLAAVALPAAGQSSAPRRVTTKRILVIEDHDDGREMLVTALRLSGHHVFHAATGREGIAQAALHSPDVVLIDIGLPDMQGYDVARELRHTLDSGVRLVALTGYGGPINRARSKEVGFHEHLLKPIDPLRLVAMLEDLT